jgi:hypothetical protein
LQQNAIEKFDETKDLNETVRELSDEEDQIVIDEDESGGDELDDLEQQKTCIEKELRRVQTEMYRRLFEKSEKLYAEMRYNYCYLFVWGFFQTYLLVSLMISS